LSLPTSNFKQRLFRSLSRRFQNLSFGIDTNRIRANVQAIAGSFTSDIPTYTKQSELNMLYELARNCPPWANALEIGSHLGASACYIAAGLVHVRGRMFCVDTWNNETMPEGEQDTFAVFKRNTRQISDLIIVVRKRSEELVESEINLPLSLVFIDGDHSYSAVKTDFEKVSPWVGVGGVIAFHDSTTIFPGVPQVIGEALATGTWSLSGYVESLCWLTRVETSN